MVKQCKKKWLKAYEISLVRDFNMLCILNLQGGALICNVSTIALTHRLLLVEHHAGTTPQNIFFEKLV